VVATSGTELPVHSAVLYYTTDGSPPTDASPRIPMERTDVLWDVRSGYLTCWEAEIPGQPEGTIVRYRIGGRQVLNAAEPDIWARDGQGHWFRVPEEIAVTTFAYVVGSPQMPGWMRDAIIYHIFLDRFHPGNHDGRFPPAGPAERHGGTLNGVRRALPYLADLGVTCLWLSPLAPSETYHRYDGTDYRDVDPALGSLDDLRALVREAHARAMRIWLDFVPSHCSWRHPAFVAARQDRTASTASWFTFYQWPDRYRSFLDRAPLLPSFNADDPGARSYLIESARFWAKDVGVDGFRLDHAIGLSMDFWTAFRVATKSVCPDFVNVGEATDTPDSLRRYRGRLDGILDFPLATALRSTFASSAWTVDRLDAILGDWDRYMEDGPGRVSFLDNHDMNRFMVLAGDDAARLKMAALCQFTLSPTPVIYYGTEIGLSHPRDIAEAGDSQARRDMPWDPDAWDTDLLSFYRDLIAVRRRYAEMWPRPRRTIHLDREAGTYAYNVGDLIAGFNTGDSAQTILRGRGLSPLLRTHPGVRVDDGIVLPPRSAALARPAAA
jgi:glycosidase